LRKQRVMRMKGDKGWREVWKKCQELIVDSKKTD